MVGDVKTRRLPSVLVPETGLTNPLLREWYETDTYPTNYSQEFVDVIRNAKAIDAKKLFRRLSKS